MKQHSCMIRKEWRRNIRYFIEWGGRKWEYLLKLVLNELENENCLQGADLLDIGTRNGKMAILFSLMGSQVTGIDIHESIISHAKKEAKRWGIPNINFIAYDGDLNVFPNDSFDIIFTKSVLVVVPDLENFLIKIDAKLRSNGRIVFIENGRGGFPVHALRVIKHKKWDYHRVNYFTRKEIKLIRSIFQIDLIKKTHFPPIYLFFGRKRMIASN